MELLYTLFGANPENRLIANVRHYASPQELTAAFCYAFFTFFQVLVRWNVLIALIVAALTKVYVSMQSPFFDWVDLVCSEGMLQQKGSDEYKFQRSKVIINFIDADNSFWMPSPLNMVPTVRQVQNLFMNRLNRNKTSTTDAYKVKRTFLKSFLEPQIKISSFSAADARRGGRTGAERTAGC